MVVATVAVALMVGCQKAPSDWTTTSSSLPKAGGLADCTYYDIHTGWFTSSIRAVRCPKINNVLDTDTVVDGNDISIATHEDRADLVAKDQLQHDRLVAKHRLEQAQAAYKKLLIKSDN